MYLFFDGVSSKWYIALFDETKRMFASENFEIMWNESTKIIPLFTWFLERQGHKYEEIENIVVVVWPGSFTWIRTISLVVNTLSYIYPHISLTPVNFFDLYQNYPIIKSSSKRDLFVKYDKSATIEIVKNEDFLQKQTYNKVYGDAKIWDIQCIWVDNYETIFHKIELQGLESVAPLYIKKPNIS